MKKTLLALAVALAAGSAFATCNGNSCTVQGVTAAGSSVKGGNTVLSGSTTSATASGAGSSSLSYASNVTTATTVVGSTAAANYVGQNCDPVNTASVGVSGSVDLKSTSVAYNVSTGAGANGGAAAGGVATGSVAGSGSFFGANPYGAITGSASGSTSAFLASGVVAGKNTGNVEVAVAGGSFTAGASGSLAVDGTCTSGHCVANSDTKTASTNGQSTAYSDKATFAVTNGSGTLANANAGSIVNATAGSIAAASGVAVIGNSVTKIDAKP